MPFFNWLSLALAGARSRRITAPVRPGNLAGVDGLLVGGGEDIDVELYGGTPVPVERIDPERDDMELTALDDATRRGLPILGVCRGSQMLNVYHGGSLHEDIYTSFAAKPRDRTVFPKMPVTIAEGSFLARTLGRTDLKVNSLHHQAVDRLGDGMIEVANDEFGIVQGIERQGERFCVGVQWHPEFLFYHPAQRRLLKAFVQAARQGTVQS
ncbi:MAG: gamma-glutamyl-gamma-aminobutyrate hydrolase family protein [Pseudomonadota bacterium]